MLSKVLDLIHTSPKKIRKAGGICGDKVRLYKCIISQKDATLIEIGCNVSITRSTIYTHDASMQMLCNDSPVKIANVVIGNNVFIGAHCIILPNTYIGNNVVIGAGSIVTGKLEGDAVYAGNPARKIMTIEQFVKKNTAKMNENNTLKINRGELNKQECAELRKMLYGKEAFIIH